MTIGLKQNKNPDLTAARLTRAEQSFTFTNNVREQNASQD